MQIINRLAKRFKFNQEGKDKGFTLIELLVVVAILGTLSAIAIPSVGKFINNGKDKAAATELHDVQTAVLAMMAESVNGVVDAMVAPTNDMTAITADATTLNVASYMVGLNADGTVKTGKTYQVTPDGRVTQFP